ncbi:MAG: hypothetical protein ACXAEU_08195 [Candidatus Hodarchaeales archaeon]|jgi:hypothetical protein
MTDPYKYFSYQDKEIMKFSMLFNKKISSLQKVKEGQDPAFYADFLTRIYENLIDCKIRATDRFYLGSCDFMTNNQDGGEMFYTILETNGASQRGMSAALDNQRKIWLKSYFSALDTIENLEDGLILIGHLDNDTLLHEKIQLALAIENYLLEKNIAFKFANPSKFSPKKGKTTVMIGPYTQLLRKLELKGQKVKFEGENVNVIVGDGLARRFPRLNELARKKPEKVKTLIINKIYPVSDDKHVTYEAVKIIESQENHFNDLKIYAIDSKRAKNKSQLILTIEFMLENYEDVVIKPFEGSGGIGIQYLSKKHNRRDIERIVERSLWEYSNKHGKRSPFPYTVCELVNFTTADWRGTDRVWDLRVYVAVVGGRMFPVSGLVRVARNPYKGQLRKDDFVVNLSGYYGLEVERGLGISEKTLKILKITEEDLENMFTAAGWLFKGIVDNFNEIRKLL